MPRARTSKSSGTKPSLFPIRSLILKSQPWCWAMAIPISYDQLVQRITGDALDKSHRFTDWTRRPLSEAQLSYAISDVTHLRDVYAALVDDLGRRGRVNWVQEEMQILTSPETYRMDPGERLAAAQNTGAQAKGTGGSHRGRGVARTRSTIARRATLKGAQGRGDCRRRRACTDNR